MPTIFESLSAAERKRIANQILDMDYSQQKEFIEQLGSAIEKVHAAESSLERKKTAIARINAAKSGTLGERSAIGLLEGSLKRAGISLDAIIEAPEKIDQIFAAAGPKFSTHDRLGAKSMLYRLGIIAQ